MEVSEVVDMLISLYINNCFSFNKPVTLSMVADMRIKKFSTSVFKTENVNILKSVGIYGPNNTGKSNIIKTLEAIKNLLLNKKMYLESNFYNESSIVELGIAFLHDNKKYSFYFSYDQDNDEIVYEKFTEHQFDDYKNEKEILIYEKDSIKKTYDGVNKAIINALKMSSKSNIVIYTLDVNEFPELLKAKEILTKFANKIEIISVNNLSMNYTISILKSNNKMKNKIINFIKHADLYLDNIEYDNHFKADLPTGIEEKFDEILINYLTAVDLFKLVSTYKGVKVPSFLYDSAGTKRISAMASYIIEALEQNKILIVDEIDSSLHFKLTRAIVSMFNNDLNTKAQLIFTTHDVSLLDYDKLLRKDQIWFTHRDEERCYLYSLADFTAQKHGIRDTTDILSKYYKGYLGALPEPELIKTLLEINDE